MGPFYFLFCLLSVRSVWAQNPIFACNVERNSSLGGLPFCNPNLDIQSRTKDLIGRLTLQEKVGFLGNKAIDVPRLGIPSYEWWSEALHGVTDGGQGTKFSSLVPGATNFPQVILTAASFNTDLFTAIGKAISTEARAIYNVGLAGLTFWTPNINIFRDPRWGRGQETPGEDPLLSSKYASFYVKGLQDADKPDKLKVAACCKHFTAYDLDNWTSILRFNFNAIVTKQDLEDTFNPPFKSCVIDGKVASVMCSYNQVNGKPSCVDSDLLAGTVRGDWKLDGYIVSDCDSVDTLYTTQHYTKTPEDAAAITIKAGLDLNCGSFLTQHSQAAIQAGKLSEVDVDKAISNNLATLMRLGFFDGNPSKLPYGNLGPRDVCTQDNQELAREAARQGIVLLKNHNDSLPLYPSDKLSIALIGPHLNASQAMLGNYGGTPCKYTTPLEGLTQAASNSKISVVAGCADVSCSTDGFQLDQAKQAASQAAVTVLIVGADPSIEHESFDKTDLNLPGQQKVLVQEVTKAAKGLVILVILSCGPFDISFAKNDDKITSILWVGYPGESGGAAIADVLCGRFNPSGRLPVTWYPQAFADKVPMTDMRMRPDPSTGYPGRTYRFYTGEVVYSFGDGLSYTNFRYQLVNAPALVSLTLEEGHECKRQNCSSLDVTDRLCQKLAFDVSLTVENIGRMAGSHAILLFNTPPAVHGAPKKHLLGFERVKLLEPHAAASVSFSVDVCRDMSLADEMGKRKLALGTYTLNVGVVEHVLTIGI